MKDKSHRDMKIHRQVASVVSRNCGPVVATIAQ